MTPAEFRSLREHLGLSPRWLADRLGVAERVVTRMETGEYQARAELLDQDRRDRSVALWDRAQQLLAELRSDADRQVDRLLGARVLTVPRTDRESPDGMPAAWHRRIAWRARDGSRIAYLDEPH